ncbi:DUF7507 domain-containing protein [Streptomyces sp. NPDC001020]
MSTLALKKTAVPDVVISAGDLVTFHYTVRNTTLHDVTVAETQFSGTGTPPVVMCPSGPVPPGAVVECVGTYRATQADVGAGRIIDVAHATATRSISLSSVVSNDAEATVTTARSSLRLEKSVQPKTAGEGDQVTYTFTVTNTGQTALSGLQVTDTAFSGTGNPPVVSCPVDSLDAGASVTCHATYTVTQADAQAGRVTNTAVVTAHNAADTEVTSPPASATLTTHRPPPVAVTCPSTTLAPGASMTCTAAPYTITKKDARRGHVTDTAHGTNAAGQTITSNEASATVKVRPGGHRPRPPHKSPRPPHKGHRPTHH